MLDYLTCGQCLKEFPLQGITMFIQHKKLDCDDGDDTSDNIDPELQCIYCPQGFMTAWGLLVHAQLTHNLKLFIERASKSLLSNQQLPLLANNYNERTSPLRINTGNTILSTQHNNDKEQGLKFTVTKLENVSPERDKTVNSSLQVSTTTLSPVTHNYNDTCQLGSGLTITRNTNSGQLEVKEKNDVCSASAVSINNVDNTCLVTVSNTTVSSSQVQKLNKGCSFSDCETPVLPREMNTGSSNLVPMSTMRNIPFSTQASETVGSNSVDKLNLTPAKLNIPITPTNPTKTRDSVVRYLPTISSLLKSAPMNLPVSDSDISAKVGENTVEFHSNVEFQSPIRNQLQTSPAKKLIEHDGLTELSPIQNSSSENVIVQEDIARTSSAVDRDTTCLEDDQEDMPECCDNQGCGITVIPGSHQDLQKCCNAVVPKKRKRHMQMKHMSYSWSSSRYARRKMLQRSLAKSSFFGKTSGTIYIDLASESNVNDENHHLTDKPPRIEITQSSTTAVRGENCQSSKTIFTANENKSSKSHSLILQPGAIFSIPFSYSVPTTFSNQSSTVIGPIDSRSGDHETGSQNIAQASVIPNVKGGEPDNIADAVKYTWSDPESKELLESNAELRRRKYPTSKPFRCDKCTLAFNQRIHLKKHMSKHTGVKPYKCGECDYSTVERSHLKVHIRIHTGEKPFKCTYCEYATAQNSTLKIHLKRHHGGKMFKCQACEKSFTQERQLKGHEWEHGTKGFIDDKGMLSQNVNIGHVISLPDVSTNQNMLTDLPLTSIAANENLDIGHVIHIPDTNSQSGASITKIETGS